ncbi:hypothetical protein FEF34_18960 [Streptomyces marianii]|uniref:Uncharacterized protein n=1 Tax=Streptomyces marianii TaxID=1817406 RepID=A0A5R9E7V9_9ACTN|nr:hypothetical protein FEF34_18960 [Streptomyces marianii]
MATPQAKSSSSDRCAEPAQRPDVDWAEVESRRGTTVPSDDKRMIETFGEGAFDGFPQPADTAAAHEALTLASPQDPVLMIKRNPQRSCRHIRHVGRSTPGVRSDRSGS